MGRFCNLFTPQVKSVYTYSQCSIPRPSPSFSRTNVSVLNFKSNSPCVVILSADNHITTTPYMGCSLELSTRNDRQVKPFKHIYGCYRHGNITKKQVETLSNNSTWLTPLSISLSDIRCSSRPAEVPQPHLRYHHGRCEPEDGGREAGKGCKPAHSNPWTVTGSSAEYQEFRVQEPQVSRD